MKLHRQSHAVYKTQYHLVWVTRYRRQWLIKGVDAYFRIKLQETRKYYPDWEFIAVGVDKDHVHLHMIIPPKYSVSKVVETIKKNTSRHLSEKFEFLSKVYWDREGIWSVGFFASTVGVDEGVIKNYVEWQGREDEGQAQLELF